MVFSSVPVYLDPPNWQQQQQRNQQHQGGRGGENSQLLSSPQPPTAGGGGGGGGSSPGSIRPGSMSDRARLAKLPQPETALKCPRCESTNTKFCYFNNYSLTQPRHFCKTCRRYWTRGGALRSVPVGGGCRRNKRSKGSGSSSRSKSPAADHHQHQAAAGSSSSTVSSNSCSTTHENMMGRHLGHQLPHQLPFLPLHHLSEYGNSGDMGLNFGGNIQLPQVVANGGGSGGGVEAEFHHHHGIGGMGEHWRSLLQHQVQQFPNFLANLEPPITPGLYPFDHHQGDQNVNEPPISYGRGTTGQLPISKPALDSTSTEGTVKMEDQNQALNLSRNFLGSLGNDHHHQYWGAGSSGISAAWTDLSAGFTSSTSHLL